MLQQVSEEVKAEFRRHVALYAKGWYKKYYNPMEDLFTIAEKTGFAVRDVFGWDAIFNEMLSMTSFCFLQLGEETQLVKEVTRPVSNPALEFSRFVRFLHNNRNEVIEQWGLTKMQTVNMETADIQSAQFRLLEINLVQAMLVTIAKWIPDETLLGEPSADILPLEEAAKKGKKK